MPFENASIKKVGICYLLIVKFPYVLLPSIYAYILENILGGFVNQQREFILELPIQQFEYIIHPSNTQLHFES